MHRRSDPGRQQGRGDPGDDSRRRASAPATVSSRPEGAGRVRDLLANEIDAWLDAAAKSRTPSGTASEKTDEILKRFKLDGGSDDANPRAIGARLRLHAKAKKVGDAWLLHREPPRCATPAASAEEAPAVRAPRAADVTPADREKQIARAAVAEFLCDVPPSYNSGHALPAKPGARTLRAVLERRFSVRALNTAGIGGSTRGKEEGADAAALALLAQSRAGELTALVATTKTYVAALPWPIGQPKTVPLAQALAFWESAHSKTRGAVEFVPPGSVVVRQTELTKKEQRLDALPATKRGIASGTAVALAVHASASDVKSSFRAAPQTFLLAGAYFAEREGRLDDALLERLTGWTPCAGTLAKWTKEMGTVAQTRLLAALATVPVTVVVDGGTRNDMHFFPRLAAAKLDGVGKIKVLDCDVAGKSGADAALAVASTVVDPSFAGVSEPGAMDLSSDAAEHRVPMVGAIVSDSTASMITDVKGGLSMKSTLLEMGFICAFIPCMLHILNLLLRNPIEKTFGKPAIKMASAQQLIFIVWYAFGAHWDTYKLQYADMARDHGLEPLTEKFSEPILTRWWTLMRTATMLLDHWEGIHKFASYMFDSLQTQVKEKEIWEDIVRWTGPKSTLVRVQVAFLVAYGKDFYQPWMRYLQQKDEGQQVGGWKSKRMARAVVEMEQRLQALRAGAWRTAGPFWVEFYKNEFSQLGTADAARMKKDVEQFFDVALEVSRDHCHRWLRELLFYALGDDDAVAQPVAAAIVAALRGEDPVAAALDVAVPTMTIEGKTYNAATLFGSMLGEMDADLMRETWPVLVGSWQWKLFGGEDGFLDALDEYAHNNIVPKALGFFMGEVCDTLCTGHCVERTIGLLGELTYGTPTKSEEQLKAQMIITVDSLYDAQRDAVAQSQDAPRHANASMDAEGKDRVTGELVPRSSRFQASKASLVLVAKHVLAFAPDVETRRAANLALAERAAALRETGDRVASEGLDAVDDEDVQSSSVARARAQKGRQDAQQSKKGKGRKRKTADEVRQEPVVVPDPHAPVAPSKTVKISALKTLKARRAELELREGAEMPSGFDDMGTELQKFAIQGLDGVIMRLAAPETPAPVVRASPRALPAGVLVEGHSAWAETVRGRSR